MGRPERQVRRAGSAKEAETEAQRGWSSGNRCSAETAVGGEEGRGRWPDSGNKQNHAEEVGLKQSYRWNVRRQLSATANLTGILRQRTPQVGNVPTAGIENSKSLGMVAPPRL